LNSQEIAKLKKRAHQIVTSLKEDMSKIRTGNITPELVEDLQVEVYGSKMTVKELGAIKKTGPSELLVEPWDKEAIEALEKAFYNADLGVSPVVSDRGVMLKFPSLTQEVRENLKDTVIQRAEEAKIALRRVRQDVKENIQKLEETHGEDFVFRLKEEMEKVVKEFNGTIEELKEAKIAEIEL